MNCPRRTPTEDAEMVALSMSLARFNDCACGLKSEVLLGGAPYCMTCARKRFYALEPCERGIIGLGIGDFDLALKQCDAGDRSVWAFPYAYVAPLQSETCRKLAARFNALVRGEDQT